MPEPISQQDSFIACRELRATSAKNAAENAAVMRQFGERPLTTQYKQEIEGRAKVVAACDAAAAYLEATCG